MKLSVVVVMVRAVARRPDLWPTAIKMTYRSIPRQWWRQHPYLPLPATAYIRFRMQTQYGDGMAAPKANDVVRYLEWCRNWDRAAG